MTANRPLKGQTFYTIHAFWCTLVRLSRFSADRAGGAQARSLPN